ncbi:MAG TPA: hypothetical protein VK673_19800 [Chthoniobacterales bacterium]|nr:hypothetical protein [Chthoniobacterales bacterium]
MDKTEVYEFAAVIAPGAVTIFGLSRIYPEIGLLINEDKISFGEFGLLLILAYVTGHLVQALAILSNRSGGAAGEGCQRTGRVHTRTTF